jgi:hypothetical protein
MVDALSRLIDIIAELNPFKKMIAKLNPLRYYYIWRDERSTTPKVQADN